ncbi:MAG: type II toxin-antitoxin system RelE/ParE family toxin [Gammaproteobacteria bacterium]|nr:type II toxin-antitoxin system RelE/ParE family toxin [Gammaproteobacteria bacterium]
MAKYEIKIKTSAEKELRKIPQEYLVRIVAEIGALSENPFPHNSIKLSGQDKYRLRVGKYRVLYSINKKILTIFIVKVAHRKSAYNIEK